MKVDCDPGDFDRKKGKLSEVYQEIENKLMSFSRHPFQFP